MDEKWIEDVMDQLAVDAVDSAMKNFDLDEDTAADFGRAVTNSRYDLIKYGRYIHASYKVALGRQLDKYKTEADALSKEISSGECYKRCYDEARAEEEDTYNHHLHEAKFYGIMTSVMALFAILFSFAGAALSTHKETNFYLIVWMFLILCVLFALRLIYEVIYLASNKPVYSPRRYAEEAKERVKEAEERKKELYIKANFIMKYLYDGTPIEMNIDL